MGIAVYNKEPLVLISAMESYFKSTPPDCSLFSDDNYGILIHKELMYQTKFMREMIGTVGIDSKIEVFCPSLSKEELEIIVDFFYNGKIFYENQTIVSEVSKNLEELFGFPLIQVETSDTKESILRLEARKQAEKILFTSESIHHDFPETAIKVERDVDYQDVSSIILNSLLFTAIHAESTSWVIRVLIFCVEFRELSLLTRDLSQVLRKK
jgi:hypothetical protein